MQNSFTRRKFLKGTIASATLPLVFPRSLRAETATLEKTIKLAAIGCGGRSNVIGHAYFAKIEGVQVVAAADPFLSKAEDYAKKINTTYGQDVCRAYQDFRDVLKRDDIDGVVVATPDHWHVPVAHAAALAGKDMYVEKPLSLALNWAKKLRTECQGKDLVFQYGTQQRSEKSARLAVDVVRSGYIGKITKVDVWSPHLDESDRTMETLGKPVPEDLNLDLYQGPSKVRPYSPEIYSMKGSWHCYDHALGFIAGWGAHPLDILQWGLDTDHTGPVEMSGTGTLPPDGVAYDTVRTWDLNFRYASGIPVRFASANLIKEDVMKYHRAFNGDGTTFHGTDGWVSYSRGACYLFKNGQFENAQKITLDPSYTRVYESTHHYQNFIDCMRSRKPTVNPLESAIRSDTISLLGDIVIRSGKALKWDPEQEMIIDGTADQLAMMDREMREPYAI